MPGLIVCTAEIFKKPQTILCTSCRLVRQPSVFATKKLQLQMLPAGFTFPGTLAQSGRLFASVVTKEQMMATPERDTVYTNDGNRTVYTRESNGTGWFVGIIVALALLAIGYLVFSANSGPSTSVDVNGGTAIESADPALAPAPLTEAPAGETAPAPAAEAPVTNAAPMTEAPAVETAPADGAAAPAGSEAETPVAEPAAPGA
jgi:hypothetical protein